MNSAVVAPSATSRTTLAHGIVSAPEHLDGQAAPSSDQSLNGSGDFAAMLVLMRTALMSLSPPSKSASSPTEDKRTKDQSVDGAIVVTAPYEFEGQAGSSIATLADPDGNYFQLLSPMEM